MSKDEDDLTERIRREREDIRKQAQERRDQNEADGVPDE